LFPQRREGRGRRREEGRRESSFVHGRHMNQAVGASHVLNRKDHSDHQKLQKKNSSPIHNVFIARDLRTARHSPSLLHNQSFIPGLNPVHGRCNQSANEFTYCTVPRRLRFNNVFNIHRFFVAARVQQQQLEPAMNL
jgi:hypothetical protein